MGTCGNPDAVTGAGDCYFDGAALVDWFDKEKAGIIHAKVKANWPAMNVVLYIHVSYMHVLYAYVYACIALQPYPKQCAAAMLIGSRLGKNCHHRLGKYLPGEKNGEKNGSGACHGHFAELFTPYIHLLYEPCPVLCEHYPHYTCNA